MNATPMPTTTITLAGYDEINGFVLDEGHRITPLMQKLGGYGIVFAYEAEDLGEDVGDYVDTVTITPDGIITARDYFTRKEARFKYTPGRSFVGA